jgi:hypothetical protein
MALLTPDLPMLQKGRESKRTRTKKNKKPIGGAAKYLTMQRCSDGLAGIKGLQARAAQIQPFSEWRDKAGAAPLDLPDGISRQRGGFTRALCAFVKLTPDISTS